MVWFVLGFVFVARSLSSTHLNDVKEHLRSSQYILACTWPGPQTSTLVKFFISSLIVLSSYRMFAAGNSKSRKPKLS